MMNRLYNLDYLRGITAFGIMIYHYLCWTFGSFTADTFIGRLGVYGVSIFYVLSGLTLFYVNYDKMAPSKEDALVFFKKRVFRIFPLLWLVTVVAIFLSKTLPNPVNLILNITGLFGFVRWDKYYSAGIWSIGNELVFYTFFPIFVLLMKKSKPLMLLFSLVLFGIYLYFAFFKLNLNTTLILQWKNYINPLNQVFLFLGGFLMGFFLHDFKTNNAFVLLLLVLGLFVFTFYPASGDAISIVTGVNRLVFTVSCFLICFCFYKLSFQFPNFIHKPLILLGEASYSVYLLHPIIWTLLSLYASNLSSIQKLPLSVVLTLLISYFIYQYFEKYFIKLGRK